MKLKKTALISSALILFISSSADAAAVAGSDYWEYLKDEEILTRENPLGIYGGLKYELHKISAPSNYPTTYHENKHRATIYVGASWLFAPNWKLNVAFSGKRKWRQDKSTKNKGRFYGNVEGKIGAVTLRGGSVPVFDALNLTNGGLVISSYVVGGQLKVPFGNWEILATGGVIDNDDYDLTRTTTIFDTDSTYLSLQAAGNFGKKFSAAIGVHNMHNTAKGLTLPNGLPYSPGGKGFFESGTEKNNTVFTAGLDYKFDEKWTLGGSYAAGSAKITEQAQRLNNESTDEEKSYSIQLTYGKPELNEIHNTAAWVAYRQLGRTGSYTPAFHGVGFGERGWEIGARHNFLENLSLEVVYFNGKKNSKITAAAPRPKIHNWYVGMEYSF